MDLLAEAFADDDVVADFEQAKKSAVDAEKPKDIDLTLPGWGDWAGPNIDPNSAKMRRKKKKLVVIILYVFSNKHMVPL